MTFFTTFLLAGAPEARLSYRQSQIEDWSWIIDVDGSRIASLSDRQDVHALFPAAVLPAGRRYAP
jgi:hypothetical protein